MSKLSQIKLGTTTYDIGAKWENITEKPNNYLPYGICDTAADTVSKEVTISNVDNFALETGAIIAVKFSESSGVASPTLNVNGTGEKPIVRYGTTAASTGTSTTGWRAGAVQLFIYDGTSWVRDFWENTTYSNVSLGQGYATCSTAASTTAKTASLSSYALTTGGIVAVKFTNDVPASATLNINSKGAKSIYHKGTAIKAGIIKAGDTATFIYSSQYHLLSVDRDDNTTYSAGTGISLSGTTFSNSGVRSISTGTSNGTISVNTNGTTADVAVKGLGSAAYTSSAAYDAAGAAATAETNAKVYTDTAVANLVSSAPDTLDTLNELAAALGDDPNFATTVANNIADKVSKSDTGVQAIAGGLVIGKSSASNVSAAGKGRIMFTGQTNPLIGVQAIDNEGNTKTPYYIQSVAGDDKLYIGPTSTKALSFDTNGNMTSPANLSIGGTISEGGTSLAEKYAAKSHGTHVTWSTTTPKINGTAAVGSETKVARGDHVHPTDTSRAAASDLVSHTGDNVVHITSAERTNWNAAYTHSQTAHAPSDAQKNQNAFSNVKVGSTTIAADTTTDTLTFAAGSNITLTPDAASDQITIAATDTNTAHSHSAGAGLTGSGNAGTSGTYSYKVNLVDETVSSNASSYAAGGTSKFYAVQLDKNNKLAVAVPWTDTNTKVTSAANHYTPAADTNSALSVDASSTTAATWNSTSLVTGVNLQRDAKGHVTGVTVDSIKMPANPNTTYAAEKGITLSNGKFGHSNSVTAATAQGSSTKTLTFSGTFALPTVTYDTYGHVTGCGTTTMTMPANPTVQSFDRETSNYKDGIVFYKSDKSTRQSYIGFWNTAGIILNPSYGSNETTTDPWTTSEGLCVGATSLTFNGSSVLTAASSNYIKSLSVSGKTITYTKGDGTTGTLTTQDTVYTHPTSAGNKHIPAGGSSGQILRWSAAGTAVWGADTDTTYSASTGLTLSGTEFSISKANVSTIINLLDEGTSPAEADDYLVAQYAGGNGLSTVDKTYYRRKVSNIVNPARVKAALGTGSGTTKYLREDGTWVQPPNTTYSNFVKSGSGAKAGLVPAPSTTAGTTKYLREDGTWQVPPDNNTTYSVMTGADASSAGTAGLVPQPAAGNQNKYLRGDGSWATPTNTTYTFTNKAATLAWGTTSTIATVGGTDITVTMPANPNTNTHYTTKLFATSSSGTAHAATTNGNTYLRLFDDSTARSSIKITGSGATAVTSDANGAITISSTNTVYTHPTTSGNKHIPAGGSSGQILKWSSDGTAVWATPQTAVSDPTASGTSATFIATISQNANGVITATKKTVRTMSGATDAAAGQTGLVPAPSSGVTDKFLRSNGNWSYVYSLYATDSNGRILMSKDSNITDHGVYYFRHNNHKTEGNVNDVYYLGTINYPWNKSYIDEANINKLSVTNQISLLGDLVLGSDTSTDNYDLYIRRTVSSALKSARSYWNDSGNYIVQAASAGTAFNHMTLGTSNTTFGKPVAIGSGGTGGTTTNAARYNLLNDMSSNTSDMTDNSLFVFKYASSSESNGAVCTRTAPLVYKYIATKASAYTTSGNNFKVAYDSASSGGLYVNVPNASKTNIGLVSTSQQQFNGYKFFNSYIFCPIDSPKGTDPSSTKSQAVIFSDNNNSSDKKYRYGMLYTDVQYSTSAATNGNVRMGLYTYQNLDPSVSGNLSDGITRYASFVMTNPKSGDPYITTTNVEYLKTKRFAVNDVSYGTSAPTASQGIVIGQIYYHIIS